MADVAAKDADTGLDGTTQVNVATFDGLEYRMKFGKVDKDRTYAQLVVDGTPARVAKQAPVGEKPEDKAKREKTEAEETKRFTDRVAREKALATFTVLAVKGKLDDVIKKRADMLKVEQKEEKKDEKKKDDKKGAKK